MQRETGLKNGLPREFLAAVPDSYLILTPDFVIIGATDAYLDLARSEWDAIVGRNIFEAFPDNPADAEATGQYNLRSSFESVLRDRKPHQMAIQKYGVRNPNDSEYEDRHWSALNVPVLDAEDNLEWIIHRVEDVTERVNLRIAEEARLESEKALLAEVAGRKEAENELEQFFSVSLDLLCISNADGYFKRLSPSFSDTLGWSVKELLERPFLDFIHPEDQVKTINEVERLVIRGEKVLAFENRFSHTDGSWRILSWRAVPQAGGAMYASARDVTELRAAEAEISELNEGLIRRAEELELARQEADRANLAKSEFLSRMSHELRTPLNAILGYGQLLELRSADERTLVSAAAIIKAGTHLLLLINEVLDLSRIEEGRLSLSLEPVSFEGVIAQAVELIRPSSDARGIEILIDSSYGSNLHVMADRQRLLQVLLNLLSNATKYNRTGGQIRVRCITDTQGTVEVEVADTGQGIDPKSLDRLFQPFERAEHPGVEGTGLGLALSKSLMILMQGKLFLKETSGEGSVFSLELRSCESSERPAPAQPELREFAHAESGPIVRIVYVEDNLPNVELLESVFRDLGGIEMRSAMRADIGLRLIEEMSPDLVLLDLHLPDMEGASLLVHLKQSPKTRDIPVIVVSADATPSQIERLSKNGARTYLTKPIDLPKLLSEIENVRDSLRTGNPNDDA